MGGVTAPTAQLVQRFVGRDAQQPGAQRPRLVEAREVLVGFEKGAIAHLGGHLPVIDEAQHGAKDGRLVGLDQRREGRLVAGTAPLHEVLGRIQAQLGDGHVCSIRYYTRHHTLLTASFATSHLLTSYAGGSDAGPFDRQEKPHKGVLVVELQPCVAERSG